MAEQTAKMYVATPDLKVGMRVSVRPNEPLVEIEDIAIRNSAGDVQVTYSDQMVRYYTADQKHEVHLTLREAVAEYYRLDREESAAFQRGFDLGKQRSEMATLAHSLGWKG